MQKNLLRKLGLAMMLALMLGGVAAAEIVALGLEGGLVVEDRGVARVGDEVDQVVTLGQMAGEGGGGVQADHHGAGFDRR